MDQELDRWVRRIFEPRRTPQQYMLVAVSDEDPDVRRDAAARVAASRQVDRDWAVKGFLALALLESDPQTRCVAVRALARSGDPRAVDGLLRILNWEREPPREVRPPDALCRWDATAGLAAMLAAGHVPPERRAEVEQTLISRLRRDEDRHVRIAAARGLGYCPSRPAVEALIAGLRDPEFAVAFECEGALVRLTGQTHEGDAWAWREWVEAHRDDLFAGAGQVPPSRQPPYRNDLEKWAYRTREFFRWLFPGPPAE